LYCFRGLGSINPFV
jgi:hypothetical protein